MKTKQEIQDRIEEITPAFELAEESYFSMINEKRAGGRFVNESDFLKIESEYEILQKELETLKWILEE